MSVRAPERYVIDTTNDPFEAEFNSIVNALRACELDEVTAQAAAVLERVEELRGDLSPEAYNMACGRAHSYLGEVASMRGERAAFFDEFMAAISHLGRTKMLGALSRAHRGLAQAYLMLDMAALALDHLERAAVLVGGIDREVTRQRAQFECDVMTGLALVSIGRLNEADKYVRAAAAKRDEIFRLTNDSWLPGLADLALGAWDAMKGLSTLSTDRTETGISTLRGAVRHFDGVRLDYWRAYARERLAEALRDCDRTEARLLMRESYELYTRIGSVHQAKRAVKWLRAIDLPVPAVQAPTLRADETVVSVAKGKAICIAGPATREVVEAALRASCFPTTVLIIGESGTGKESLARVIHDRGPRAKGPFVAVNCASISKELMDSDLFGHAKGAFTGAAANKIGKFEAANDGTIFLDEIGEIPVELQAKLLRALEESQVQRLGENNWRSVNVRVIVATNRNLEEEVFEGRFREDLFHRINGLQVHPRPLRERRDEIPYLSAYLARQLHKLEIDADAVEILLGHDWPGNVRELRNVLDRTAADVMASGEATITREIIEENLHGATSEYRRAQAARDRGRRSTPESDRAAAFRHSYTEAPERTRRIPSLREAAPAFAPSSDPRPMEPVVDRVRDEPIPEDDDAASPECELTDTPVAVADVEAVAIAPAEACESAVADPGVCVAEEPCELVDGDVSAPTEVCEPVVVDENASVADEPCESVDVDEDISVPAEPCESLDVDEDVSALVETCEPVDVDEDESALVETCETVDVDEDESALVETCETVDVDEGESAPVETCEPVVVDEALVAELVECLEETEFDCDLAEEVARHALAMTGATSAQLARGPVKSLARLAKRSATLSLEDRAELFAEVESIFGVKVALACIGRPKKVSYRVPRSIPFLHGDWEMRGTLHEAVRGMKRYYIKAMLVENDYNLSATCRALGLNKPGAPGQKGYGGLQTLHHMLKTLGIEIPPRRSAEPAAREQS